MGGATKVLNGFRLCGDCAVIAALRVQLRQRAHLSVRKEKVRLVMLMFYRVVWKLLFSFLCNFAKNESKVLQALKKLAAAATGGRGGAVAMRFRVRSTIIIRSIIIMFDVVVVVVVVVFFVAIISRSSSSSSVEAAAAAVSI